VARRPAIKLACARPQSRRIRPANRELVDDIKRVTANTRTLWQARRIHRCCRAQGRGYLGRTRSIDAPSSIRLYHGRGPEELRTTDSRHDFPIAPPEPFARAHFIAAFAEHGSGAPNITYVPRLIRVGFYLATAMDPLQPPRAAGWAMGGSFARPNCHCGLSDGPITTQPGSWPDPTIQIVAFQYRRFGGVPQ